MGGGAGGSKAAKEGTGKSVLSAVGSLLVRLSTSAYCPGVARDSPYSVATATVTKASRPSGASSPSAGEDSGPFVGESTLDLLLLPSLGLVSLALAGRAVAVAADDLELVPVEAVTPYMGLTVLKGLAWASTHCSRALGLHWQMLSRARTSPSAV